MKQYEGRIMGNKYSRESIICNGIIYSVDRTQAGLAWCIRKGMAPAFTIAAGGEAFTVYAGIIRSALGVDMAAACAIPA